MKKLKTYSVYNNQSDAVISANMCMVVSILGMNCSQIDFNYRPAPPYCTYCYYFTYLF